MPQPRSPRLRGDRRGPVSVVQVQRPRALGARLSEPIIAGQPTDCSVESTSTAAGGARALAGGASGLLRGSTVTQIGGLERGVRNRRTGDFGVLGPPRRRLCCRLLPFVASIKLPGTQLPRSLVTSV